MLGERESGNSQKAVKKVMRCIILFTLIWLCVVADPTRLVMTKTYSDLSDCENDKDALSTEVRTVGECITSGDISLNVTLCVQGGEIKGDVYLSKYCSVYKNTKREYIELENVCISDNLGIHRKTTCSSTITTYSVLLLGVLQLLYHLW